MTECTIYRITLTRNAAETTSTITDHQGVPLDWSVGEVMDWVSHKFGDLIDDGWIATAWRAE